LPTHSFSPNPSDSRDLLVDNFPPLSAFRGLRSYPLGGLLLQAPTIRFVTPFLSGSANWHPIFCVSSAARDLYHPPPHKSSSPPLFFSPPPCEDFFLDPFPSDEILASSKENRGCVPFVHAPCCFPLSFSLIFFEIAIIFRSFLRLSATITYR